jgi:tRNA pseudouridine(55) synthase
MELPRYVVLSKKVGETPLQVAEAWRETSGVGRLPLAYAGRLDPMASGQLLVLVGDECKNQTSYHNLDKEYEVEILLGVKSDSGDVLGIVSEESTVADRPAESKLKKILDNLVGEIELHYPIFSSKTVLGKPLHTWTMEGRLDEITIPTKKSSVYQLELISITEVAREDLVEQAIAKVNSVPPVTDLRKALGNDFRRPDVRAAWGRINTSGSKEDVFYIIKFRCVASSGTYMRTLAEVIAKELGTTGLAFSIHRTKIGRYNATENNWGYLFE